LEAAYELCGLLARFYPEQSTALVAAIIQSGGEEVSSR
jgi:hypothetical protein